MAVQQNPVGTGDNLDEAGGTVGQHVLKPQRIEPGSPGSGLLDHEVGGVGREILGDIMATTCGKDEPVHARAAVQSAWP